MCALTTRYFHNILSLSLKQIHSTSVRFGDKHIKGSPFTTMIEGEPRKRNQVSIGSGSEVTLPGLITDDDLRSLNAMIQVNWDS